VDIFTAFTYLQDAIMFIISKVVAHSAAPAWHGMTQKHNSCACTCHRTDVEDEKMKAVCMTCNCAFEFINLFKVTKEKESRQRKRKVEPN
jgi:hypothetical protein